MRRKVIFGLLIPLLAITLVFYAFSSNGVLAFDTVFSSSRNFDEHTFIGPFDISNHKKKAATAKLESDFERFHSNMVVVLTFQDVSFELPPEIITLNVDKTIEQAQSGKENEIVAVVSFEGIQTILHQQFAPLVFSDETIESIVNGIEKELEPGILPVNVHVTDYIGQVDGLKSQMAMSTMSLENPSSSLLKLMQALDGTEIDMYSSFSLLDFIESNESAVMNDYELTLLASSLYSTILQTNFQVDERNIGSTLTDGVEPGFEAAINQKLGLDLTITNPTKTAFTLNTTYDGHAIHTGITGFTLLYSYEPYVSEIKTFDQKTVQRFSAFLEKGQVLIEDKGTKGMEVIVHRKISSGANSLEDDKISSDFYAPIPKVELHPLARDEQSSTVADGQDTSGTVTDEKTNKEQPENVDQGTVSDNKNPSTITDIKESKDQTTDLNDEHEIIYDKGGNIVN